MGSNVEVKFEKVLPEPPARSLRGAYHEALRVVLADKDNRPAKIAEFDTAQGASRRKAALTRAQKEGRLPGTEKLGTTGKPAGEWEFVALNTSTDEYEWSELHVQYHPAPNGKS